MKSKEKVIRIAVREIIEFILRCGSIHTSYVSSNRAVLGTRAHKKIQDSMDGHYEKEVKLISEDEVSGICFVLEGRADGIITDLVSVTIDEIKSTYTPLSNIDEDYNLLHWAQVKCYGYMYAKAQGLSQIRLQLTYYHLETHKIKRFIKSYTFEALETFYLDLLKEYSKWVHFQGEWVKERNQSLKALVFPFEQYRPGQRTLAIGVYEQISKKEHLFINAPTGIGKTLSTLFPTLKAMGEKKVEKVFYLCAKNITREVAKDTLTKLRNQPIKLKSILLTAKDKICLCETRQCTPKHCDYANGHYDRINEALYELIKQEDDIDESVIKEYAKAYKVCPFELSLDVALFCDVIIGDYNYVFDPSVRLKRFEETKNMVYLVDEAHNLVDRARSMYSAHISQRQLIEAKYTLKKQFSRIQMPLTKLINHLYDIEAKYLDRVEVYLSKAYPKETYEQIKKLLGGVDYYLGQGQGEQLPTEVIQLYFECIRFNKIYEYFDESYVVYSTKDEDEILLKMFCVNPKEVIRQVIKQSRSTIFFSATLLPMKYYKDVLGGEEAEHMILPSPFDKMCTKRLITTDISTRYKHREQSYKQICEYIHRLTVEKVGNYMIFFPSYLYMEKVYEQFIQAYPQINTIIQRNEMENVDKIAFLNRFEPNPVDTLIGFCVLGGVFSEGVDLVEDRLIGVVVVGVGLPGIDLEKRIIQDYFDEIDKEGYHFAYTYPGMNKVLQAIGRLIRTEQDRGIIMLIDDRFRSPLYQNLFPPDLHPFSYVRGNQVSEEIHQFWCETK